MSSSGYAIPSNTLAVVNGMALDCKARGVLGEDVDIDITAYDETNTHIRPERIAKQLAGQGGLVAMVGVQSNQFPRAMDMARKFRAVECSRVHGRLSRVGCLSMLPELPPELKEAMDLGISLLRAEGRFEQVLVDAWNNSLQPLYNYMADLPSLQGAVMPIMPASRIKRTAGEITSFDAGRGCHFL